MYLLQIAVYNQFTLEWIYLHVCSLYAVIQYASYHVPSVWYCKVKMPVQYFHTVELSHAL